MKTKSRDRQQEKIDAARREVAHRVKRLQTALERESTWIPNGQKWLLPLAAVGVGLALTGKKDRGRGSSKTKPVDTEKPAESLEP